MNDSDLQKLLEAVGAHSLSAKDALVQLKNGPFRKTDLGYAQLDHHRSLRHGLGEVIYGESKTAQQILGIAAEFAKSGAPVLITRLAPEKIAALAAQFPGGRANAAARTFIIHPPAENSAPSSGPHVAILAAGTGDLPVAEEACEVCVAMETAFVRHYDVGVAGLHRLLSRIDAFQSATVFVVVAGMEGALPSVVAGLLGRPVFAVPTSIGYGASFGGIAALLAMLNSCAPGVTVANIDNGFSAAFAACQVVRAVRKAQASDA
jgi:NCAIR mutase (PurE)-related protein